MRKSLRKKHNMGRLIETCNKPKNDNMIPEVHDKVETRSEDNDSCRQY